MIHNYLMQAAIATALASGAGSALAYLPTSNTDADKVIYWAGASASTQSAQNAIIDFVCDPAAGSVNVMSRASNWAVACNSSATKAPALGDARVMVVKRDNGGSGVGVGPLQQGTALNFLDVSTGAGGNCLGDDVAKTSSGGTPYLERSCASGNVAGGKAPDIGSSDIEPGLFTGSNAPLLNTSDGPGVPANGTPFPFDPNGAAFARTAVLGDLVFNTPVTTDLYKALQAAQFASTSPCYPSASNAAYSAVVQVNVDDPATTVDEAISAPRGDTEACMPSLTREEIASIMTGQVKNWEEFKVLNPATNTVIDLRTAANNAGLVLPPLGSSATPVQICRRVAGSGTQAQLNSQHLGVNCGTDVVGPRGASTIILPFVAENSSATNVEQCLDDFNQGTNTSNKNSGLVKRWAIGVRSTETSSSPLATSPFWTYNYRFVKIDGIAPTIENVHRGDYWNFATQNLQASPTADADTLAVFDIIAENAFTVAGLKSLNTDCKHGFGRGCWLGTPKAAGASPVVFDVDVASADPVNNFTRAPNNLPLNTCQLPIRSQFSTHFIGAPVSVPEVGQDSDNPEEPTDNVPSAAPSVAGVPLVKAVRLTYTRPISNGGQAITRYIATCTAPGRPTRSTQGTGTLLTVSGLLSKVSYRCSVQARNAVGLSAASAAVTLRTD